MSFLQLTTWISKHAILATSIFLILTSTVGVFAAEGLAPKEFKPSSILTGNNKSGTVNPGVQSSFTGCLRDGSFVYGDNGSVNIISAPC